MSIETSRDPSRDLTIHVVSGLTSTDDMIAALEKFYSQGSTLLTLWDMSQSELSQITSGGIQEFIKRAAELGIERKGGRTAVVATEDLQYGLGRMAESFALFEKLPFRMRLFRAREEAMTWLFSECKARHSTRFDSVLR